MATSPLRNQPAEIDPRMQNVPAARMLDVRLGDIRSNPHRMLDKYPLERERLNLLKASMQSTIETDPDASAIWSGIQARILPDGTVQQAFGHHRVAAGIELFGPDYVIAVEIRNLDDYGMYSALGFENADYGNRNAHYNEIVEAARNWFDDEEWGIFAKFPTWEAVEAEARIHASGLPSRDVLFKAFGGNSGSVPGNWAKSVAMGVGADVLEKFIPSLSAHQIRSALSQLTPSPRRFKRLAEEQRLAKEKAEAARLEAEQAAEAKAKEDAKAALQRAQREAQKKARVLQAALTYDDNASNAFKRQAHGEMFKTMVTNPPYCEFIRKEEQVALAQCIVDTAYIEKASGKTTGAELTADYIKKFIQTHYIKFAEGVREFAKRMDAEHTASLTPEQKFRKRITKTFEDWVKASGKVDKCLHARIKASDVLLALITENELTSYRGPSSDRFTAARRHTTGAVALAREADERLSQALGIENIWQEKGNPNPDEVRKASGVPDTSKEPDWDTLLVWLGEGNPIPDEVSKALGSANGGTKHRLTKEQKLVLERGLAELAKNLEQADTRKKFYDMMLRKIQEAFSIDNCRLIRSCLHPDREAPQERKHKAFLAFDGFMEAIEKLYLKPSPLESRRVKKSKDTAEPGHKQDAPAA